MPPCEASRPDAGRVPSLGVVGVGRVFLHLHEPALRGHPSWRLAGVFDPDAGSVREALVRVPEAAVAGSLEALLDGVVGGPLDGVLILSPPALHVEQTLAALERGIPALVEKPMALERASAERLLAASRSSGVPVQVGFNRRFRPPYVALRDRIAARPEGLRRIRALFEADVGRWSGSTGMGPLVHDLAAHLFDLVRWLAGREFETVVATGGEGRVRVHGSLGGDVEVEIDVARRRGYREWVLVEDERGASFVHPAGRLPGRLVAGPLRGRVAGGAAVLEGLRARAKGGVGHTRRSLVDQLTAFAELAAAAPVVSDARSRQGPAPGPGEGERARRAAHSGGCGRFFRAAGALDGLRAVELTEAALASLSDGTPRPVPRSDDDPTGDPHA